MNIFAQLLISLYFLEHDRVEFWILPGIGIPCATRYHPENGKSLLSINIDKIDGQTVDLEVRCRNGHWSWTGIHPVCYEQKNLTTGKNNYIALDNNQEGTFFVCFTIIPDNHCKPAVKQHALVDIITDKNEVDKIIDSIFNQA